MTLSLFFTMMENLENQNQEVKAILACLPRFTYVNSPCCVTALTVGCSEGDSHMQRSERVLHSYAEQLTNWKRERTTCKYFKNYLFSMNTSLNYLNY